MTALEAVVLVVSILVFIAVLFVLVLIPVRRRAHRLRDELQAQLGPGVKRVENVRGLGTRSLGKGQVRGNGWLALTPTELAFRQWVPDRETRIPLADIVDVGTEKTWLGKWVGATLLRVTWRTADGGEDAIAWQVPDLEGWLADVQEAMSPSAEPPLP